jgi:alpha-glucosidase
MSDLQWWRGAVIYQVYPRSMMDTNGDGIGDIPGIVEKLDYIAELGVDAIWVSPFFKSPMKDFGYDISDYRDIDPIFGALSDFDQLIEQAHARNIKVIIDQVLSHTSDQHHWFTESRQDKHNDKADWYVWADAKDDGTQPNNWLSIFGGPAWKWEPRRKQYYLHNFLSSQPDLNFHNPDVQQAALENIEFWLKRGVDGFRLDAINFCFHDKLLRDNPAKAEADRTGRGFSEDNPYAFQYHYYNNTQPENIKFIEQIRALLDRYPGSVALGEISSEDSLATMAEYTSGNNRLHMGYSFELLTNDYSAQYIRHTVETLEQKMTEGWPCWAISNHDVTRVVSRWAQNTKHQGITDQKSKMFTALLGSLKGSVCSYQGEELGLPEAEIEYHELQDPYGITFWPNFKGRDGCRTPLPWNNTQNAAGFSQSKPWLPVADAHLALNIEQQSSNSNSVLNAYRQFLNWRKQQDALINGDISFFDTAEPILAFLRKSEAQTLVILFNLSEQPQKINLSETIHSKKLTSDVSLNHLQAFDLPFIKTAKLTDDHCHLPGFGCFFAELGH